MSHVSVETRKNSRARAAALYSSSPKIPNPIKTKTQKNEMSEVNRIIQNTPNKNEKY